MIRARRCRRLEAPTHLVMDPAIGPTVAELIRRGVTTTLVSHRIAKMNVPSIMHDNEQGIGLLSAHLLDDCSRHCPVFLRGSARQLDARQQGAAFRRECMRPTVAEPIFLQGDFEPATAVASLQRHLDRGESFDALLGADYRMAIAAAELLRARGLRVPEDVAVAGFGDGPDAEKADLTTSPPMWWNSAAAPRVSWWARSRGSRFAA